MAVAEAEKLQCYNKGCGTKFLKSDNHEGACTFHPGVPVFHDALKGWSCCKKRSTDFTDFLNIPGCTKGLHNPVKPVEPEKEKEEPLEEGKVIKVEAPKPKKPVERPPEDTPFVQLKIRVGKSLETSLARLRKKLQEEEEKRKEEASNVDEVAEEVAVGTKCRHCGCEEIYEGPDSDFTDCVHHPGIPIFHEGYKFWTCCQRRTSDWNEFMRQEGCRKGSHLWKDDTKRATCRYDWHQTSSSIIISVFTKNIVPEESKFQANPTNVIVTVPFEGGEKRFEKSWKLTGVIDPSRSSVELLGTKAEIKLRKADASSWKYLFSSEPQNDKQTDSIAETTAE